MTKKQTGQVSVKSLKLNKKPTKPCFWLTKDEKIALFKENPNQTFIILPPFKEDTSIHTRYPA